MNLIKLINEALRFFLEIALVISLSYAGLSGKWQWPQKLIVGIALPLILVIVWSIWMAPNSDVHLTGIPFLIGEIVIFGGALLVIYLSGRHQVAISLAVLVVINTALLYLLGSQ